MEDILYQLILLMFCFRQKHMN